MCYLCKAVNQTQSAHMVQENYEVIAPSGNSNLDNMMVASYSGIAGRAATVTYNFGVTFAGSWGTGVIFNESQKQIALDWQQKWANVANLTFTETSSSDYDIAYNMFNLPGTIKGISYMMYTEPRGTMLRAPIQIDTDNGGNLTRSSQNFMYSAVGHEIGHSLGIDHTFITNDAGQKIGLNVIPAYDNVDWSMMSYSNGPVSGGRVTELMYGDILIAQYMYGANTSYNAGNNDYNYGTNDLIPFALWDGGGADTIRATNAIAKVTLDLRDDFGSVSTDRDNSIPISGGTVKFWVAKNANIENAIGGNFNDDITGNHLANYLFGGTGGDIIKGGAGIDALMGGASHTDTTETGNDTLSGGADGDIIFGNGGNDVLYGGEIATSNTGSGNDTLFGGLGNDLIYGHDGNDLIIGGPGQDSIYGGGGNDTYVIGWGNQVDLIYQFEGAGVAGGDVLRIINNVNNSGIDTAAEVIAAMTNDGNHTWLNLGGGNGVLIAWATRFVESDFSFGNTVS